MSTFEQMKQIAEQAAATASHTSHGMSLIPAGVFLMGAEGWGPTEEPVHEVYLDAFWLETTPVTNAAFLAFVEATGYVTTAEKFGSAWGYAEGEYKQITGLSWTSFRKGREDHPVVLVSWHDANAYARWAGKRLPTEAEWEKAACGGRMRSVATMPDLVELEATCHWNQPASAIPGTAAVGSYNPNDYGLYDMGGNVWNWCSDWHGSDYYKHSPKSNPAGPLEGMHRVRRGGAFNVIQPFRLRASNRGAYGPDMAAINIGFRCALSVSSHESR
jgi:formylglycine-generating enzyme